MRTVLLLMLLAAPALAGPKPMPAKFATAASDAFAKAQAAEAKGDLDEAARQYTRANEIAPHPNTIFNLAEVQRRGKHFETAIATYKKYLELAPEAADRAAVAKLLAELEAMPGTLEIETEEPGALAYVDGRLVGPAPRKVEVPAGTHNVDIVTPITFAHMPCPVSVGGHRDCRVGGKPRVDGNVIISATWSFGGLNWPVDHQRFQVHGRFVARPGHYELKVHDRQCKPLPLDVPAGDDVLTYAYITAPQPITSHGPCVDLKIAQQRVAFP